MPSDLSVSVPAFFQGQVRHSYEVTDRRPAHWSRKFRVYKASFDVVLAVQALPLIAAMAVVLFVINPWFNPGPVFFRQERLGLHRKPFTMLKFRTMTDDAGPARSAEDGLEHHRVRPLGRILRHSRLDELPNFINVLRGEMSTIGPRPDAVGHAETYLERIPHYAFRYMVKPGITGLAQIETGYAEGIEATAVKAAYDQIYVETSCGRLDVYIALRTILVMSTGAGAK